LASEFILSTTGHISDTTFDDLLSLLDIEHDFETKLLWVLRDFGLEFKSLTPNSYLAQCLEG